MRFRYVPSGTYTVGSPEDEPGRFDWEWPRHQARLTRGFWLAETELTQNQWSELVQKNPSQFKDCGGSCPVERVSWFEAARFANRLSEQEGLDSCYALEGCTGSLGEGDYSCDYVRFEGLDCPGYRLPTEAEWEVAARAGNPTAIYAPELDFIAWYGGNSGRQTHRAGRKEPNAWGLADMLGNVYEWTGDGSTDFAPATGVVVDPLGAKGGANRVFRGGSWSDFARYVRAAFRNDGHPSFRVDNLGFRLARGQVSSGEAEPRVR